MKESPIFTKTCDLLAWLIPLTMKFPREQRFVLARSVQQAAFATQEHLVRAGHSKDYAQTLVALDEVVIQLGLIRFYLRLSQQMAYLDVKQYEYVSDKLTEIGRLLEGWRKTCKLSVTTLATSA